MTFKTVWYYSALFLYACGGAPKEPAQVAPESSATLASDSATDTRLPKSEPAKPEVVPEPDAACDKDSDCTIFTDCCSCRAVSSHSPLPESCEGICGESKCEVKGKTISDVTCVSGKCKLK